MVWENRHHTRERMMLRGEDGGRKGLQGKDPWKKLLILWVAERAIRAMIGTLALVAGPRRYPLPDMEPHG